MEKCCYNCAWCSESYPSFVDSCDMDGRVIKDVYTEVCEKFEPLEVKED